MATLDANLLSMQLEICRLDIVAWWSTIQRVLPMTKNSSIDINYRLVIIDRLKTWEATMHQAEGRYAEIKRQLDYQFEQQLDRRPEQSIRL